LYWTTRAGFIKPKRHQERNQEWFLMFLIPNLLNSISMSGNIFKLPQILPSLQGHFSESSNLTATRILFLSCEVTQPEAQTTSVLGRRRLWGRLMFRGTTAEKTFLPLKK